MAVHTKHVRRQKNVSGRSSSLSATKAKGRDGRQAIQASALGRGIKHAQDLSEQLNARKVDLIKVDLETAFTFAKIAQEAADNQAKRIRNRQHARRGYDAVRHFLETARLEQAERDAIDRKIDQLKGLLGELGESFV